MANKTIMAFLALASLNALAQTASNQVITNIDSGVNPFAKTIRAGDSVICKVYKETLNKEKIYMDVTGRIIRPNGSKTILSGTDPKSKKHALIKLDIKACVPEGLVINDDFKIEVKKASKVAVDDFDNFTNEVVKVETNVAVIGPVVEIADIEDEEPHEEKAVVKEAPKKEDYTMGLEGIINKTIKAVKTVDEKGQGGLAENLKKKLAEKKKKDESLKLEKVAEIEKVEDKTTDNSQQIDPVAEKTDESSIEETKSEAKPEKKGVLVFLKDLLFGRK